ncbi:MAG: hypothetical protein H0V66_12765 [Bdellovibrionales bacterium]|nr:hypothetical protein [Bdellovibrionales bacterium]
MKKLFIATMAAALALPVMADSTQQAPTTTTTITAPQGAEIESTTTTTTKTIPQNQKDFQAEEARPSEPTSDVPAMNDATVAPPSATPTAPDSGLTSPMDKQQMEDVQEEQDQGFRPHNEINDLDEEALDNAY